MREYVTHPERVQLSHPCQKTPLSLRLQEFFWNSQMRVYAGICRYMQEQSINASAIATGEEPSGQKQGPFKATEHNVHCTNSDTENRVKCIDLRHLLSAYTLDVCENSALFRTFTWLSSNCAPCLPGIHHPCSRLSSQLLHLLNNRQGVRRTPACRTRRLPVAVSLGQLCVQTSSPLAGRKEEFWPLNKECLTPPVSKSTEGDKLEDIVCA